jgi:hypothetical protein
VPSACLACAKSWAPAPPPQKKKKRKEKHPKDVMTRGHYVEFKFLCYQKALRSWAWWLTSVIPATQKDGDQEDSSRAAGEKCSQDLISTNSWMWCVCACHPSYLGGINRSRPAPAKPQDRIKQITKAKRVGGVAQVLQHLPSKPKFKLQCLQKEKALRATPECLHIICASLSTGLSGCICALALYRAG